MRQLTDFGDVWWHGKYSDYFYSFWGQVEYILVRALFHKAELSSDISFGDLNRMGLYLSHWSYSPFVDYVE
jgi:hypothetical protein